jgi:Phosphotransferase System HPr (HPr) Family
MVEKELLVANKTGLHARPAAKFVKEANKYKSTIQAFKADKKADAKSIIGILGLGITQGSNIIIRAAGEDECLALEGLKQVIEEIAREDASL